MGAVESEKRGEHYSNYVWRRELIAEHFGIDGYLNSKYQRTKREKGYREANIELREMDQKLRVPGIGSVSISDDSICNLAGILAKKLTQFLKRAIALALKRASFSDLQYVFMAAQDFCSVLSVELDAGIKKTDSESRRVEKYIKALNRVCTEKFWKRKLRVLVVQTGENVLRNAGFVRAGKAPYVSNWAFKKWVRAQRRNAEVLKSVEMKNELGDTVLLEDCVKRSVANPVNRRHELMTRMRGFEDIAKENNYAGFLLTMTCPSKYHAQLEKGGANKNYAGYSPRQAMDYLMHVWALVRAEWAQEGIRVFGFRFVEPHHDGTPHMHLPLFIQECDADKAMKIFREKALEEDGFEPGAQERRVDVKRIDPAKGSATGYVAKYVSKNIDGHGIDWDFEAEMDGQISAARVRAWASVWNIRQFQPISTISVTVWRELRKKRGWLPQGTCDEIEALSDAVERKSWAEFCNLMGGVFAKRTEQTLRIAYMETSLESRWSFDGYSGFIKRVVGVRVRALVCSLDHRCEITPGFGTRAHVWHSIQRGFEREGKAQPPPSEFCQ